MKNVGFIGLGIMGTPMALNLVKAGYKLTVYNRDGAKCAPLVEAGARQVSTPREVAAASEVTLAMVSDPEAALAVALGTDGAAAGLGPGCGYVDVSTVDAGTAVKVGEAVTAAGGRFLEAPVSGSKKPAEDGAPLPAASQSEQKEPPRRPLRDSRPRPLSAAARPAGLVLLSACLKSRPSAERRM